MASAPRPVPLREAAPAAFTVLFGALLLARTWMTWPMPTHDVGRELAVPARVAAGERLYRDVVANCGPLPVWLHALAFRLLGDTLAAPLALLLPAAALTFASLWVLARRAAGPAAAFWGVLWGLSVALVAPNNGALVYPYSFASAHALAFSAAALAFFPAGRAGPAVAAALWAAALASKPEWALASIGAALLAEARGDGARLAFPRRSARAAAAALLAGGCVYALAFRGAAPDSLRKEGPLVVLAIPPEWRNVYRIASGLDAPLRSLGAVATAATLLLGLLVAVEAATRLRRRTARHRSAGARAALVPAAFVLVAGASVAALGLTTPGLVLDQALPPVLRALPAAVTLLVGLLAAGRLESSPSLLALAAFAALGSARAFLNVSVGWGGTPYAALAVPALAAAAAAAAHRLLPGREVPLGVVLASLVTLQAGRVLRLSDPAAFAPVPTSRGTFRMPVERAAVFRAALDVLARRARPGDGLAAFPEGGYLTFVLGLPNPLRQEQILPGHLDAGGERAAIERLRERPPRFVVLLDQPAGAFGPVAFGRDYAQELWAAAIRPCGLVASIGAPASAPVGAAPFFIRIYERRPVEVGTDDSAR